MMGYTAKGTHGLLGHEILSSLQTTGAQRAFDTTYFSPFGFLSDPSNILSLSLLPPPLLNFSGVPCPWAPAPP